MKILVTGGAGFIGSAVCRHIIARTHHSVVNVDKLTYAANLASLRSIEREARYQFHRVDICDSEEISRIFEMEQPDAVIHLAAESHVDRSIAGSTAFIQTNVVGTHVLLEAARTHWERQLSGADFRFLHVSTDEVFGALGEEGAFVEETRYRPSSPYSASKAASDHLARAWHATYGLPILVSNCSNNYGPYHFPEKLIPLAILNAIEERPLSVYGDGSNIRDWLFVEDHAAALLLILTQGTPGQSYNIGSRSEHSNLAVVQRICDIVDERLPKRTSRRALISFVADRPGHDYRYAIDATKIERELGWRATETFESGLRRTVDWYLANEDWWRPLRKDVYRGERLGLRDHPNAKQSDAGGLRQ